MPRVSKEIPIDTKVRRQTITQIGQKASVQDQSISFSNLSPIHNKQIRRVHLPINQKILVKDWHSCLFLFFINKRIIMEKHMGIKVIKKWKPLLISHKTARILDPKVPAV